MGPQGGGLDPRAELSEFLRTRRARLKPQDVGLPDLGRHRRVPGLRREELAQLAGVSVAYYTRLEQGNGRNVSAEVLDAIARALRLSDAEHAHLTHLARPGGAASGRSPAPARPVRRCGSCWTRWRRSRRTWWGGRRSSRGTGWRRLSSATGARCAQERNWARLVFLDPAQRELFVEWEQKACDMVAYLRMDAGGTRTTPRCPRWWANCP